MLGWYVLCSTIYDCTELQCTKYIVLHSTIVEPNWSNNTNLKRSIGVFNPFYTTIDSIDSIDKVLCWAKCIQSSSDFPLFYLKFVQCFYNVIKMLILYNLSMLQWEYCSILSSIQYCSIRILYRTIHLH